MGQVLEAETHQQYIVAICMETESNIRWYDMCTLDFFEGSSKTIRCEQGSNLRGKIPLDFKSNALTTRPSQHENSVLFS